MVIKTKVAKFGINKMFIFTFLILLHYQNKLIEISKACDFNFDCQYQSDELYCQIKLILIVLQDVPFLLIEEKLTTIN